MKPFISLSLRLKFCSGLSCRHLYRRARCQRGGGAAGLAGSAGAGPASHS